MTKGLLYVGSFFAGLVCAHLHYLYTSSKNNLTIIAVSGKRMSGKDTAIGFILKYFRFKNCCVLNYSTPLKQKFSEEYKVDYDKLINDRDYKEIYRNEMTKFLFQFSDRYFPDLLYAKLDQIIDLKNRGLLNLDVVIIGDVRQELDANILNNKYKAKHIKISTTPYIKAQRGWKPSSYDSTPVETSLDNWYRYNKMILNDGGLDLLEQNINEYLSQTSYV